MSADDYQTNLARIEAENPREILLRELRLGYSPARCLYMRAALKRLSHDNHISQPTNRFAEIPAHLHKAYDDLLEEADRVVDEQQRALWRERGRLYVQMRKIRNEYHDCKTDAERRTVNDRLQAMWSDFLRVKAKIAHFEAHGEHEPAASDERFPLPTDGIDLVKKLNSLRARISQEEKKLRELAALPKDHPEKATKIQKSEAARADLILYRNHAERAIEAARVQSRGLEIG